MVSELSERDETERKDITVQNMTTTTTGLAFQAIAFFFFFCSFISSASADEVIELSSHNFKNQVGRDRHVLVEFYTPGCGHCKQLTPEYEMLPDQFKKEKSVLIAKVDCDKLESICKKFDLNGYPTIRWFPKGSMKPEEYIGRPTAENIAEFVNAHAGTKVKIVPPPSTVVVLSADNFNKVVMDETKHVLVKFYAPWCGRCKTLAPIYEKLATAFNWRKMWYAITGFPTFRFFPKNNKSGEDYSGGRELSHFVAFINEKSGTHRDANGRLTDKAGIIESLDNLVKKFVSAIGEEKKIVYALMKEEVDKLTDSSARHGKIYLKAAKNEVERISRIASSKTISHAKSDEFALKKNILSSFT